MSDILNKLLILRSPGIGAAKYNALIQKFGTPTDVVAAMAVGQGLRDTVLREIDMAVKLGVEYVDDESDYYPQNLKEIKNHPPVICVRGNLETLKKAMVAIVGTRHATATGMEFVADIADALAENGNVIVSGMAMGTDTAAHRGALRNKSGVRTVAVLAGGVDYIWPQENESLYWEIVEHGAIISEMPVGFKPVATNFVQRNRIVAGIANRLILGEADMKSGSMTTARFAIDFGCELWAIPSHPADSRAMGPNSLIQTGVARLCMGKQDFITKSKNDVPQKKIVEKNDSEISVLDALGTIPVSESVLAQVVKKSVAEIKSQLVVLELQGLVRKIDGGYVRV